jgi:hypothetical protein
MRIKNYASITVIIIEHFKKFIIVITTLFPQDFIEDFDGIIVRAEFMINSSW